MTNKELRKLHELKGSLDAHVIIARNDADRVEATLPQMESRYFKGYYQAEANVHRWYACKFERLLNRLTAIIEEAKNA